MVRIVDDLENCTHVVVDDTIAGSRVGQWITESGTAIGDKLVVRLRWLLACEDAQAPVSEDGYKCPLDEPATPAPPAPTGDNERPLPERGRRPWEDSETAEAVVARQEAWTRAQRSPSVFLAQRVAGLLRDNMRYLESRQERARREWQAEQEKRQGALKELLVSRGLAPDTFEELLPDIERTFSRPPPYAAWGPLQLRRHNEEIADARRGATADAHRCPSGWSAMELQRYVRYVARCTWKELLCNGGMACPGEDPHRVLTADLESILQEDPTPAEGLPSCYEIGRSNGTTGGLWAELDDKLALFGVEGLRSLGKGAEPEALSRVVIDRILIDACQQPGAILSLVERLGTVADVERGERDFPTGVCDYVLRRRPEGKITAIVEAKRCLNGDMSLLSSGAVQLALCCSGTARGQDRKALPGVRHRRPTLDSALPNAEVASLKPSA